jgi:hypothetical protein
MYVILTRISFSFSIDAEGVEDHICQFVNDASLKEANSLMKLKIFSEKEYLCLFATRDIKIGEEILYNYGDEKNLWWRSKVRRCMTFDTTKYLLDLLSRTND